MDLKIFTTIFLNNKKCLCQHTTKKFNRPIQLFHYLQPIHVGQLDGMKIKADERKAYQHQGYYY